MKVKETPPLSRTENFLCNDKSIRKPDSEVLNNVSRTTSSYNDSAHTEEDNSLKEDDNLVRKEKKISCLVS